jgi:hypothetical protein
MVNGAPPNWYQRQMLSGGQYHGRRVSISPDWAIQTNPHLPAENNTTPFDKLLAAASSSALNNDMAQKIEAVLAVLLADRMACVGASATLQGTLTDIDQVLRSNGGQAFILSASSLSNRTPSPSTPL